VEELLSAVPRIRVLSFEDGVVVFSPRSWDAHILNPAAGMVLALVLESPRRPPEIEAFLAEMLNEGEHPHAGEHAERLINDLRTLGLIEEVKEVLIAHH